MRPAVEEGALKQRSLVRQTVWIVLAAQLLCAVALALASLQYERHTRLHALDVQMEGRSDSLRGAIQDAEDANDNVHVDPSELRLPQNDIYAVYTEEGRLLGASEPAAAELVAKGENGFRNARAGDEVYRVLQREAMRVIDRDESGGVGLRRPVILVYASPEGEIRHEIAEAFRFYLLAIAIAAAATALIVAVLLRRALQPISDLAAAAGGVSAPALAFRPPATVLRVAELQPVVRAFERALAGLREAFAKEQRFVGDAAHELKTSVAVLRSSVQVLMLRHRSAEEYEAGLQRVLEDNQRMESLVAQMLQLASTEELAPGEVHVVDMAAQAAAVVAQLAPVANARGVSLQVEATSQARVRLSDERASVLISNLVMNAVQHSPAMSAVEVGVETREGDVVLYVADHGAGIGREALPHIFERFYREDTSRSRNTGGTGLGLSICKSIADAAGARIEVESEQGQGTTVSVVFRLA